MRRKHKQFKYDDVALLQSPVSGKPVTAPGFLPWLIGSRLKYIRAGKIELDQSFTKPRTKSFLFFLVFSLSINNLEIDA